MANDSGGVPDGDYDEYAIRHDDDTQYNFEWLGLGYGAGYRTARVFEPDTERVYEGEIDDEEQHIRLDEDEAHELDEDETIGDYIARVGNDLGWAWLSEFAHDNLETTGHDASMDVIDATFDRRNVADDADFDAGFFGSYTYRDDDGHVHTLEREFDVYTDEDQPVVSVEEVFLSAIEPDAESRAGDAAVEARTSREIPCDVGPNQTEDLAAIDEFCREWHQSHPDPL